MDQVNIHANPIVVTPLVDLGNRNFKRHCPFTVPLTEHALFERINVLPPFVVFCDTFLARSSGSFHET